MKAIKEIISFFISTILLIGGLGIILSTGLLNGIFLVGIVMILVGLFIWIYIIKDILENKWKEIMSEIQKRIDSFYKEYGKNKPKVMNNRCAKRKKICPYLL